DHVHQAGLVLQRQEADASGGGGPLPVGDDPGDVHQSAVGYVREVRDGGVAGGVEVGAHVGDGVRVRGRAGGPEVREGLLDRVHRGQGGGAVGAGGAGQVGAGGAGQGAGLPEGLAPAE